MEEKKKNVERKVSKVSRRKDGGELSFVILSTTFRPVFIRGLRALRESWRETRGREREKREEEKWKGEESGRGRNELIFIYANGIGGSG